jgi:hypothetical protein
VSRALGVFIIVSILVSFIVDDALGRSPDTAISLAFLTIATGLVGIPSGYSIVKRNGSSNGS